MAAMAARRTPVTYLVPSAIQAIRNSRFAAASAGSRVACTKPKSITARAMVCVAKT